MEEAKTGATPVGTVASGNENETGGATVQVSENDYVALASGKTIGRYEIVSVLGQGGFGITYRARDAQLNREVAIKEYLPTALAVRQGGVTVLPRSTKVAEDFGWGRQRFVDEGRTLASLQHAPAIVQVFDFLEANGTAYIIMRLVPGDTLESRLKQGTLSPPEIDRIIWPLLDGLEQVHNAGFLHRDIKPANILLDASGNPTLIDFGASRAAIAGRTAAMTAIFTPGYAAAEQMTSARQGPWTDIYGVSATLYHAITGAAPPSAFDRMLDDAFKPLTDLAPGGYAPGLLVGIDAGLAVRASDRPQSIAGWRAILAQAGTLDSLKTLAMAKPGDGTQTVVSRRPSTTPAQATPTVAPPAAERKLGAGRWIALATVAVALVGGGYWWYATNKTATAQAATAAAAAATKEKAAQEAAAKAEVELQKERAAQALADQQKHDAEIARQAEERAHQQFLAEQAAKEKADADARAKAAAEQAAKAQADAADRAKAEAAETALHFSNVDRQHIQVALTALGYATNGTDGVFGQRTRDMIAAWQTKRGDPNTGFLAGTQQQALMRDAAPAIAKFDDDQKKSDADAKAKADADAKAKAASATAPPPAAANTGAAASSTPTGAANSADGHWRGTYQCGPNKVVGPFVLLIDLNIRGGAGTWRRPGSGPGTGGNQSINVLVTGKQVVLERLYYPPANTPNAGMLTSTSLGAQFDGNSISGSGPESSSGGRHCILNLTRG